MTTCIPGGFFPLATTTSVSLCRDPFSVCTGMGTSRLRRMTTTATAASTTPRAEKIRIFRQFLPFTLAMHIPIDTDPGGFCFKFRINSRRSNFGDALRLAQLHLCLKFVISSVHPQAPGFETLHPARTQWQVKPEREEWGRF